MAETPTIADVKSDYKIFQSFSDNHITERINDAIAKAQHNQISDDALTRGIISWTRHLLYTDWFMSYGGVQSAGTFGNTQTMVNFNGADPYLQEYNQIVDDYGVSDEMGAVWTE